MVKYLRISSYIGSTSSYMSLLLLHSEFPYIWGKFDFLFISVDARQLQSHSNIHSTCTLQLLSDDTNIEPYADNLGGLSRLNYHRLVLYFLYTEGCILFGSFIHGHEVRWQSQSAIVNPICSPTCRAILTYRDRAGNHPRNTGSGSTTPSPPSSEKPPTDPGWNTGAPTLNICCFFTYFCW